MRRLAWLTTLACLIQACGGGGGGGGGTSVYYVRANAGSDSNMGASPDDAFATINAAVARAKSGDTIIVGPGTYRPSASSPEAVVDIAMKTAAQNRPITIRGDDGSSTNDNTGEVLIDAADHGFGFRITNSANITLDNLVILGARGVEGAGVQIRTDSNFITVRNCEITENADGIRIESSNDSLLFNNLIHDNQGRGIQISAGSNGTARTQAINNTIATNQNDGISGSGNHVGATTLSNNLLFENGARGIDFDADATGGYDSDFNLVFPTEREGISVDYGPDTPKGLNDINLDPLFVGTYRLAQPATGDPDLSPAIDTGDPDLATAFIEELRRRSTATNDALDVGAIDIGFHFPSALRPPPTPTNQVPPTIVPTAPPSSMLYVRINGSDSNDGRSPGTAFRSIQMAADTSRPGTEIIVGPGTYGPDIHVTHNGLSNAPIVFRANPSGNRTGDPAGSVIVDGGGTTRGFFVDGAAFVVLDGFVVQNAADAAIHVRRMAEGVVIQNCEIFASREDGIRIQDSANVTLLNNLVYCNARRGILVAGSTGSDSSKLVNNTVVANRDRGIFIGTSTAPSANAFLRNNISQDNCNRNLQVVENSVPGYNGQYQLVSPPSYSGVPVDPTDTAYGPDGAAVNVPAGFVTRASCEGICPAPPTNPPDPTQPRPTPKPLPSPIVFNIEHHEDDFRLKQTLAGDPPPDGVGVDQGDPSLGREYTQVLRSRSTAANGVTDGGRIDLGYHFEP